MSLRLFAALAIPDDVADRLLGLQRGVPGAQWRPRENLHLTLRFFGEIPEPQAEDLDSAIDEATRGHAPFEIALKGAGFFGKDEPHTLWIGVGESAALNALAADCERAARRAGLRPETRKFAPHVTIAYLRGAEFARVQAFEQRHGLYASRAFGVGGFGLYSSHVRKSGPSQYRLEAEYALMG